MYDAVKRTILTHPAFATLATDVELSPFWSVVMGFEHERIHIETSSGAILTEIVVVYPSACRGGGKRSRACMVGAAGRALPKT